MSKRAVKATERRQAERMHRPRTQAKAQAKAQAQAWQSVTSPWHGLQMFDRNGNLPQFEF
jgi:hypothetical protein